MSKNRSVEQIANSRAREGFVRCSKHRVGRTLCRKEMYGGHVHEWRKNRGGRQCQTCGCCQIKVAGMWSSTNPSTWPAIVAPVAETPESLAAANKLIQAAPAPEMQTGPGAVVVETGAVLLLFNGKPPRDVIDQLHIHGACWSVRLGRWVVPPSVPAAFVAAVVTRCQTGSWPEQAADPL